MLVNLTSATTTITTTEPPAPQRVMFNLKEVSFFPNSLKRNRSKLKNGVV
jgi:hypothetical protein